MKSKFLIKIIPTLLLVFLSNSYAAEGVIGESELIVNGNTWEFKNKENTIFIIGKVKAVSPDFTLWCDHLTVLYNSNQASSQPGPTDQKVEEVHAKSNVIIDMNNGYTATSEKADYSKEKQEIVLSENASVRSSVNQVRGCVIRYNITNESYSVESCPDEKAGGNIKQK